MSVTPAQLGVEIGTPTPTQSQVIQWQSWIDQAYFLVKRHYGDATYATIPVEDVDHVVLMVVAARADPSRGATQVDVSVDDGRVSKRYPVSQGRVTLDDWWDWLDPDQSATSGAFTINPYGEPDRPCVDAW